MGVASEIGAGGRRGPAVMKPPPSSIATEATAGIAVLAAHQDILATVVYRVPVVILVTVVFQVRQATVGILEFQVHQVIVDILAQQVVLVG